jgi:ParB-like chromosome segregation protein Spo0J
LAIDEIAPLHSVTDKTRVSRKYSQILSSIKEVGIIEPPVVAKSKGRNGYILLDGHLRIDVLKSMGAKEVSCLVSTDDEGFTYNRRVNRLAIIQEHKMVLKAIDRGVPEARIAKALNIDTSTLKHKIRLLDGICRERQIS